MWTGYTKYITAITGIDSFVPNVNKETLNIGHEISFINLTSEDIEECFVFRVTSRLPERN